MINKADAVNNLRPNTEWTMSDDNIATIIWHTQEVKPITAKELENEMARLQTLEAQKPIQKAALLERLGISEAEAKLLLS